MTIFKKLAQGISRAGAEIITHVPGYGAGEVFRKLNQIRNEHLKISFHEETAYTIAHGAALAGKRSACLIKAHGLAKAANSVVDSLFTGVNAGFVTCVFHDREGRHSDSIIDSRKLIKGLDMPSLEVVENAPEKTVKQAYELSQDLRLPVALLVGEEPTVCTSLPSPPPPSPVVPFQRDIAQCVLCPPFARYQRDVFEAKRSGGNWQAIQRPAIPRCPDEIPSPWREICEQYVPLFQAFQLFRGELVSGETGLSCLFALPPFNAIDVVTYMGGSIPLGLGFLLAGHQDVWAVSGDFSFLAAGHLGLAEALNRELPLKILILQNGRSATTGGERIPEGLLERTLRGYEEFVLPLSSPESYERSREVLEKAHTSHRLTIVLADYRHTWKDQ